MKVRSSLIEDRALIFGVLLSFLWHFFWFFTVTVTVGPTAWDRRTKTRSVVLGAVLDDSIFRTLVENRPQISEAFYRHISDFEPPPPAEPKIPETERYASGDVVSVPFGKKFVARLKEFMDGEKLEPDFSAGPFGFSESLEGDIRKRTLLSRTPRPDISEERRSASDGSEVLLEFTVTGSGQVTDARAIISSGDAALDRLWSDYVEGWHFESGPREKGRVRLKL